MPGLSALASTAVSFSTEFRSAFFLEFITSFSVVWVLCSFFLLLWGVRLSLVVFGLVLDVVFVDFVQSIVSVGVL